MISLARSNRRRMALKELRSLTVSAQELKAQELFRIRRHLLDTGRLTMNVDP